jgi:opacity protein-like surface antigen
VQASWADDVDLGIGGRIEIGLDNKIATSGPLSRAFFITSFDYFFWDCDEGSSLYEVDCSYWELNPGIGVPLPATGLNPYVGAGLNIARASVDLNVPGFEDDASDTEIGLNLLGGLKFNIGSLPSFVEGRLELGGGEQFVLTFGVNLFGGRK